MSYPEMMRHVFSSKMNGIIFCAVIWIIFFSWYFLLKDNYESTNVTPVSKISKVISSKNQKSLIQDSLTCIQDGLSKVVENTHNGKFKEEYPEFYKMINNCSKNTKESLNLVKIKNYDEYKYYLQPLVGATPCNIVTLGIGRDVEAELELKRRYNCTFLGADPDDDVSGKMFERTLGGKFVKAAIGRDNGLFNASIINDKNHQYHEESIYHLSFKKFLDIYNGDTMINMLFIDIEGAEFELLEYIFDHIKEFPFICQINVELHFPDKYPPNGNNIINNLYKTTNDKQFLIIHVEPCGVFYRIFMINTKDDKCINTYFRDG